MRLDSIPPAELRRLAGGGAYGRGVAYADGGRVHIVEQADGRVVAEVEGGRRYRVELDLVGNDVHHLCTCPMGEQGDFCKHCVAVAVSLQAHSEIDVPTVEDFVASLDRKSLAAIVLEQARQDPTLAHRLMVRAASAGGNLDVVEMRHMIDVAFDTGGFVGYREMPGWIRGLRAAVSVLADAAERGLAADVVDLVEYALAAWEEAVGNSDDSDGMMGDLRADLYDLHVRACELAAPDPDALAERLFTTAMESDWETFLRAVETHAGVLGSDGLATYRRLVDARWQHLPALAPGDAEPRSSERFAVTHIMELLAEASGDVDELAAVLMRDLSHSYNFVRIAAALRDAGRLEDALQWAERGLAAFADGRDMRLQDLAADLAETLEQPDRAVQIHWDAFARHPGLAAYQRIAAVAVRTGRWEAMRPTALEVMWADVEKAGDAPPSRFGPQGATTIVQAMLWEGDIDAAWGAAQQAGCSPHAWLSLADARAADHPEDAAGVYRSVLNSTIQGKTKQAYGAAVELLHKIRDCLLRAGTPDAFEAIVAEVRANHRPKRNLMAMLNDAGW